MLWDETNSLFLTTSMATNLQRVLTWAVPLLWLGPKARGENSISYKYADYQELGGRVGVQTQGAFIEQDLGPSMRLKLTGILDAIAGATPTGQPAPAGSNQVPLARLHEYRKAWNADLSRQFSRVNLGVGIANSRESDYVSTGWSVNAVTDFNQKNTTLLTGVAGTDDTIKVFYQAARATKRTNDLIVGVTQLLDPRTSLTVNLSWGRQRGQISDPYKLVQKNIEIIPGLFLPLTMGENRPGYREKWVGLVALNRAFPEARGAVEGTYRYYHDTFGADAHTVDVSWFQRVGETLILKPSFRFYDQSAAQFYAYDFDRTNVIPRQGVPNPGGPFYSSDFRMSDFQSRTYGLKAIWKVTSAIQFDAGWEWYDMRGTDDVTPESAYCRARIITVGAKFTW
jgi:hypothetical protein